MATEVKVPDIGDFTDVPVVSVLVSVGDKVNKEDPLIELESDKATMEVPSEAAGTVKEIKVSEGDKVSEGSVILVLEADGAGGGDGDAPKQAEAPAKSGGGSGGNSGGNSGGGSVEVKVPDIGDFKDVPVVSVLVSVGDTVAKEDPLIELESDKATMEVPSSAAGKVKEIKLSEGDKVSEGDLILVLERESGGSGSGGGAQSSGPSSGQSSGNQQQSQQGAPQPYAASQQAQKQDSAVVTDKGFGKVHASPSVRAFARKVDVDLTAVNGTGRKGRILREDVMKAMKAQAAPAAAGGGAAQGGMGIPPVPAVDFSKFGPVEEVEMSRIKKISGPALHRSWLNIPHVTHQEEADITELDKYRKELDTEAKSEGYRVTLLSFVVKASVSALKKHWEFNASLHPDGDKLIKKDFYNIGFAADTPNGLMVPVIKDADRKGIVEISKDLMNLSAAARDGKLKSQDMQGATFTISSLGGIGGTAFTPIVNAPEVAILGLTRSKMAPVWDGEQFVPRNMLPMSLSYDHRAIDGALAARFAAHLKYLLGDARRLML